MLLERWQWFILVGSVPFTLLWVAVLALGIGGDYDYFCPVAVAALSGVGIWTLKATLLNRTALLWFVILMSTVLLYRVREETYPIADDGGLNWQNMVKLAVWACLWIICGVNWRRIAGYLRDPSLAMFIVFLGVAAASTGWSSVPTTTIATVLGIVTYVVFACLAADTIPTQTLICTLLWALAVWCIISWALIAVIPGTTLMDPDMESAYVRFQGISGHPNLLGAQAALFLVVLIGAYHRDFIAKQRFYLLLTLGILTLLATQSRTSAFALTLSVLALQYRRALIFGGLAGAALLVFVGMAGQVENLQSVFVRGGDPDVLAGRTAVWEYLEEKVSSQPIIGYGFNSFESNFVIDTSNNFYGHIDPPPGHPHNNFLDVLFGGGFLALIPYVAWNLLILRRWFIAPDMMRDLPMLFVTFSSFSEVNVPGPPYLGTLVLFVMLAIDARCRLSLNEQVS